MDLNDGLLVWNDDERDTSDIYNIYKRNGKEFKDEEDEYIPIYKILKELYDEEKEALYNNSDYESGYYLKYDNNEYFNDYSDNDEEYDVYSDDYYIDEELNGSSAKHELESNNEIYDKLIYDKFYYY